MWTAMFFCRNQIFLKFLRYEAAYEPDRTWDIYVEFMEYSTELLSGGSLSGLPLLSSA